MRQLVRPIQIKYSLDYLKVLLLQTHFSLEPRTRIYNLNDGKRFKSEDIGTEQKRRTYTATDIRWGPW